MIKLKILIPSFLFNVFCLFHSSDIYIVAWSILKFPPLFTLPQGSHSSVLTILRTSGESQSPPFTLLLSDSPNLVTFLPNLVYVPKIRSQLIKLGCIMQYIFNLIAHKLVPKTQSFPNPSCL